MESKLEKHTHILGRAKGKLSGYRKKGISRNTHFLERSEIRTCQEMESKQATKGHSHPREGRRLGLVRIWKASKLARNTHCLERAEVGIGENMESKQASKGHSQTREGRGWDW